MKRVLVVLLALVMGAGLLFAADQAPAKWGAYLEGNYYLLNQDSQMALSDDGTGQYTEWYFSYTEDVFGFSMTGVSNSNIWPSTFRNMAGWYKLFNGMLKVTVAKPRIADYRPATYIRGNGVYTRLVNSEWGVLVQAYPMKPLSVGAFVAFPEVFQDWDTANAFGFGASYALDGIGTFYFQYRTQGSDEIGVAAKVTAIKGLPLLVGYRLKDLAYGTMDHQVYFSTQYVMDPLTLSLDVCFQYETAATFAAELLAEYALNKTWHAGAYIGYADGMTYGDLDAQGGFELEPFIQANIGSAHTLKLSFLLDTEAVAEGLHWAIPFFYSISF